MWEQMDPSLFPGVTNYFPGSDLITVEGIFSCLSLECSLNGGERFIISLIIFVTPLFECGSAINLLASLNRSKVLTPPLDRISFFDILSNNDDMNEFKTWG